jgi:hypothetical protein
MPKVTFTLKPMVQVVIRGERAPLAPGELPRTRVDGGLIHDLLEWERTQHITPLHFQSGGGGHLHVYYTAADAERVRQWLLQHHARRVGWRLS